MFENSAGKIVDQISRLASLEGRLVLEIGCGGGRITSLLVDHSPQLVAVDVDHDLIARARAEADGAALLLARGEELPFADDTFDLVLFTLSLHHQQSGAALGEASRVLKADGRILVVEPAEDGEVERFFTVVHDETKAKRRAQQAIRKSDLTIVESEIFGASWMFADQDELCRSLFEYYDLPFDEDRARRISALLGKKRTSRPIVLADTLIIQSLAKAG